MATIIKINGVDKTSKLTASKDSLVSVARNLAPTEGLPGALTRVSSHVNKLDPATVFEILDGEQDNALVVKFTAKAVNQLSQLIADGELQTIHRPSRGKNGGKKGAIKNDADDAWE